MYISLTNSPSRGVNDWSDTSRPYDNDDDGGEAPPVASSDPPVDDPAAPPEEPHHPWLVPGSGSSF